MYFVYRFEIDGTLTLCSHSKSLLDARELLLQEVHDFIADHEGSKKIVERELKAKPESIDELSPGYWFRIFDKELIRLYFKNMIKNTGFFGKEYLHEFDEVCYYSIVSYDKLNGCNGFTPVVVPEQKRIKPTPDQISPLRRELLKELKTSPLFLKIKQACIIVPEE